MTDIASPPVPVEAEADIAPARKPEEPGPAELRNPLVREELQKAGVWFGVAIAIALAWMLAQPLLLIFAGIVFASMLDGGTRLLGRVLPIGRAWRLAIVTIATFGFLAWTVMLTGAAIADQATTLQGVIASQTQRAMNWAAEHGVVPGDLDPSALIQQTLGSVGRVTNAIGSAFGVISSAAMVIVLGIFIAIEPRLYERGVAWMMPMRSRSHFYDTSSRMGFTLRRLMAGRLLGMGVEGIGTWALLALGGVPMPALLGLLTGLLAFIPNIGAIVSGVLLILVGFSVSVETGYWAIGVYLIVQIVDGYIIVPMVAKRTVDLAPALVLGAQILFGALFGLIGLALADPIIAMIKVALESQADRSAEKRTAAIREAVAGG